MISIKKNVKNEETVANEIVLMTTCRTAAVSSTFEKHKTIKLNLF